jgi:hypothetical protein
MQALGRVLGAEPVKPLYPSSGAVAFPHAQFFSQPAAALPQARRDDWRTQGRREDNPA